MDKLQIEYLQVDQLKPYDKNARYHSDEDINVIKNSIKQFGFNDPIGIWGKDNLIVEGHGRLLAAKQLGYKEVPIIRLDHLSDEERKAYTLAHNKLTMNSDFDIDILQDELDDILNINMSDFGFDINFQELDFDEKNLEDERQKEKVQVSIVLNNYQEYEAIKERIENLTDEVNGNLSIKMI